MAKKTRNKGQNNDLEILENPEAIAEQLSKGEEYVRKNSSKLTYVLLGIVVVVGGLWYYISQNGIDVAGFTYYNAEKEQVAQEEMFQAQFYFEQDSFQLALMGGGAYGASGFESIIEEYPVTRAANLAKFYAGVCNMKLGNLDEALTLLEDFSTSDKLLEPRKYALIGDIQMEYGDLDKAIKMYKKASELNPNMYYTPTYLMKLALAHENNSDYTGAVNAYDRIIKEFPNSSELNNAKKYKQLAESKI